MNIILGAALGYGISDLEIFVHSVRAHMDCELVLLVRQDLDAAPEKWMKANKINMVKIAGPQ